MPRFDARIIMHASGCALVVSPEAAQYATNCLRSGMSPDQVAVAVQEHVKTIRELTIRPFRGLFRLD